MLAVVAPVDHRYEAPALEVSVTLPPVQKVRGPLAVIVGVAGKVFTVTVVGTEAEDIQPAAFVTCTEYEPVVLTVMLAVVAPVDHRYEVPALEVRVTLPPVQNVSGPPAVIVGVEGTALTVTFVAAEGALRQPAALVT